MHSIRFWWAQLTISSMMFSVIPAHAHIRIKMVRSWSELEPLQGALVGTSRMLDGTCRLISVPKSCFGVFVNTQADILCSSSSLPFRTGYITDYSLEECTLNFLHYLIRSCLLYMHTTWTDLGCAHLCVVFSTVVKCHQIHSHENMNALKCVSYTFKAFIFSWRN